MSILYFYGDTYPPVQMTVKNAATGAVFEDITNYTFSGAFVNPNTGAVKATIAASRFAIVTAADGTFKYTPQAGDILAVGAGEYRLRVTCTRPSSGGSFTRLIADTVTIRST